MQSCYGETPPLIAEDKIVTTVMNRSINVNALLAQPKEHGPRDEQGNRQLLDIMMPKTAKPKSMDRVFVINPIKIGAASIILAIR